MSIEILREIKKAEEQAEQIKKQSISDARQIITDAHAKAEAKVCEVLNGARAQADEILKASETEALKEIAHMEKETESECVKIKEHAAKNMDKAADIIAERIRGVYGNR